ncbi:MAG: DUF4365 domain-containing protein, partial [Henriciella sp.]|uniref:DUF4365 domain-containing protein n=1 Tax=Henriciella sp. TaxID=1968823 RepID=UPI003C771568
MTKTITQSQILGELGETAVKKIALEMGFIYETRGRLEAGIDGFIELRDSSSGASLGKILGVQVKSTSQGIYTRETDRDFEYLIKPDDLWYWKQSNIPVIIIFWRQCDRSTYWKHVPDTLAGDERRLRIDKQADVFNAKCVDRLGALTVDRRTPGVFVPPLNEGETVVTNLLRIRMPNEIFIATSPFGSGRDAVAELVKQDDTRHDWVIRKRRFVSFFDPRSYGTRAIVDEDQVEAVDADLFVLNEDLDDTNDTIDLLRRTVEAQLADELRYARKERLFYFKATAQNAARKYAYMASTNQTSAMVVSVYPEKSRSANRGYVRHHAANFRFERLGQEWFIVIDPSFYFTRNGYEPHRYADVLLSGKKRLERNAAVRGQVIMWQHLLLSSGEPNSGLFAQSEENVPRLRFEHLPVLELSRAVPESSWNRTDPRAAEMGLAQGGFKDRIEAPHLPLGCDWREQGDGVAVQAVWW